MGSQLTNFFFFPKNGIRSAAKTIPLKRPNAIKVQLAPCHKPTNSIVSNNPHTFMRVLLRLKYFTKGI